MVLDEDKEVLDDRDEAAGSQGTVKGEQVRHERAEDERRREMVQERAHPIEPQRHSLEASSLAFALLPLDQMSACSEQSGDRLGKPKLPQL